MLRFRYAARALVETTLMSLSMSERGVVGRRAELLRRHEMCREPASVVARRLGLSLRNFSKERRAALEDFAEQLHRLLQSLPYQSNASVEDVFSVGFLRVDNLVRAGECEQAADALQIIIQRSSDDATRFAALERLVAVRSQSSKIVEARRVLRNLVELATKAASTVPNAKLRADLAEAELSAVTEDDASLESCIAKMQAHCYSQTSQLDRHTTELLVRSKSLLASRQLFRDRQQDASKTLDEMESLLNQHPIAPLAQRAQLLLLKVISISVELKPLILRGASGTARTS